jgi:hypothetical protein
MARVNLPSVDPLGDRDAAAPPAASICGYATASGASPPAVGMSARVIWETEVRHVKWENR